MPREIPPFNVSADMVARTPTTTPLTSKDTNPKDAVGIRKAPMSSIPNIVLAELGVAMLEGAAKYGRANYRASGVRASVYYDAAMRHLIAWWEGENIDPDSGLSHVTKAIATLVVLRDAMLRNKLSDDRPPKSEAFYPQLNKLAGEIIDRYADRSPHHYTQLEIDEALNAPSLSGDSHEALTFHQLGASNRGKTQSDC